MSGTSIPTPTTPPHGATTYTISSRKFSSPKRMQKRRETSAPQTDEQTIDLPVRVGDGCHPLLRDGPVRSPCRRERDGGRGGEQAGRRDPQDVLRLDDRGDQSQL